MRVELEGLRIDVDVDGEVVSVDVSAIRDGRQRKLGVVYLNEDDGSATLSISEPELRLAGLAAS